MSRAVISVEHVWKQYRLGTVGSGTLSQDVKKWWYNARGKENPFAAIAEDNDRSKKGASDHVWALQDISFKLNEGEVLGIVGKNGAGKSTMLKLLSRVTAPTRGEIKAKGRIASLLEVGTGFHPELTGRENIFLNGSILGMRKAEIHSKFDEIVAFSGVERYIDTPVKRYSSGMYVRLAFAVAAHLEPEIMIVDEVLAVGDAEFQRKCIGKMKDASGNGRTILFVSHNMVALRSLCTRAILLEQGKLTYSGEPGDVIGRYLGRSSDGGDEACHVFTSVIEVPGKIKIHEIRAVQDGKEKGKPLAIEEPIFLEIDTEINAANRIDFTFQFRDEEGNMLFVSGSGMDESFTSGSGEKTIRCTIPGNFFNSGKVNLNLLTVENRSTLLHKEDDILRLIMVDSPRSLGQWMGKPPGAIRPKFNWKS